MAHGSELYVAICWSVIRRTPVPNPQEKTRTPVLFTATAASMAVCSGVLPGAASIVCSPSETISMTLATCLRPLVDRSCPAALMPSEIEVWPSADIWSMPALISAASYDHPTRVVASTAKDTTEKRTACTPRA